LIRFGIVESFSIDLQKIPIIAACGLAKNYIFAAIAELSKCLLWMNLELRFGSSDLSSVALVIELPATKGALGWLGPGIFWIWSKDLILFRRMKPGFVNNELRSSGHS
jgi:hypothetical protein